MSRTRNRSGRNSVRVRWSPSSPSERWLDRSRRTYIRWYAYPLRVHRSLTPSISSYSAGFRSGSLS